MEEEEATTKRGAKGSWTGVIIVIIVIALGGAYFWYVKSGAMKELDERNKALENQSASPADLFKEFDTAK